MDLTQSLKISAAGMKVQGVRLKVIAENLANADSISPKAGEDPYRRKVVTFQNVLDRKVGADLVKVKEIGVDKSDFRKRYDASHPAADADGYVSLPNVNPLVELMDMREAQRSYEANVNVIGATRRMIQRTLEILKA